MSCNTTTCTGYHSVLHTLAGFSPTAFWVKDSLGNDLSAVWGTDKAIGNNTWIGVEFADSTNATVAWIKVYDCEQNLVDTKFLNIVAAKTWQKWEWVQGFGINCARALLNPYSGTGHLPATPPPEY